MGLGGGASWLEDADLDGTGTPLTLESEVGWLGSVSAGYAWLNGFRTELELAYRQNELEDISPLAGGDGDYNAGTLMANVFYDFRIGSPFTPYVGVGIGAARLDMNEVGDGTLFIDDQDHVLAWQGIAGVSYEATDNLKLFADYRYLGTDDPSFSTAAGVDVDSEYRSHAVLIGFRWQYGVPRRAERPVARTAPPRAAPPPPAPEPTPAPRVQAEPQAAPQPAVARDYLVFFDWDSAELQPAARDVLSEAADNRRQVTVTQVRVTGHADRSGPASYNEGLSLRRAEAVKNYLMQQGVPEGEIRVMARGEQDPLVPTGDGVREPQNRRVEIILEP